MAKTIKYRGHGIKELSDGTFDVYTRDEMEQPAAFRYADTNVDSLLEAKQVIDEMITDERELDRALADTQW